MSNAHVCSSQPLWTASLPARCRNISARMRAPSPARCLATARGAPATRLSRSQHPNQRVPTCGRSAWRAQVEFLPSGSSSSSPGASAVEGGGSPAARRQVGFSQRLVEGRQTAAGPDGGHHALVPGADGRVVHEVHEGVGAGDAADGAKHRQVRQVRFAACAFGNPHI